MTKFEECLCLWYWTYKADEKSSLARISQNNNNHFFADFRIKFQSNIQLDNASCLGLCNWQGKDLLLLEWFEQIPVGYKSNSIWLFVTEKSIKELLYPVFTAVNLQ